VAILIRGDSHYGRIEAITLCECLGVGYIFGLGGNSVLLRKVTGLAEDAAVARIEGEADKVRRWGEIDYATKSWPGSRFIIITNLAGSPRYLYETLYCARGQAENLIKAHKLHLASDRTSCTSATANQFRLLVHTAAYWLMHTLRGLTPTRSFWRLAQFDTFRIGLIKVATRIKVSLPSAFPYQTTWALLTERTAKLPP
jgi:hypothetical protein